MSLRSRFTIAISFIVFLVYFLGPRPSKVRSVVRNLFVTTDKPLRREWRAGPVPETQMAPHHLPGFSIFRNLYIFNGTIFIVTTRPESVPEPRLILSQGLELRLEADNVPDQRTLSVVTPKEAKALFGDFASLIDGVSFIQTDGRQFLQHYYHFVVEIFAFWHWRCYTSPDYDEFLGGSLRDYPRRWIFPRVSFDDWIDRPRLNLWTLQAAFGGFTSLEFQSDWDQRMGLHRPFVFDTVILGDRAAWHRNPKWRELKEPKALWPLRLRDNWWSPIRELVTTFAAPSLPPSRSSVKPVITYISRQKTSRRLRQFDHLQLVSALEDLCRKNDFELSVPTMEDMPPHKQIHLLSRTTVLIGVHGNGLSGQLWLKPSPRTTVIEIFYPGGFIFDYEYVARVLGHTHYGVWNDTYFTAPNLPKVHGPPGFHGSDIPVSPNITELIYRRLTLPNPMDA
ncbi:hypothetical protein PIIN_01343 [Serendipita indica DSM 11827]|uniref:Glycosyltransferase 61 catalytic domain-containing protein n=1 Tax=Serendipita indica (strain DSM 11827) TaxID=1109443 RepID=G4T890_SERID|nr:hypothetical protein PIIN_01343 [Serendipita indica DSM 11827]